MKHILIVSAVFPPEPVTTAYMNHDLAMALQEHYEVTVLRAFPSRPEGTKYTEDDIKKDLPYRCITLKSYTSPSSSLIGRFRESISFGRACKRYIREHHKEYDYVYNASWQLFGYYIVAKTAVKYGLPYMIPVQDIYPETLFTSKCYPKIVEKLVTAFLKPLDCFFQRHAHKVRTITDEMKNYLSETRNVSKEQYLVVNNWQENDLFIYVEPKQSDAITFAYVGSVNNHSNTEFVIESFLSAELKNAKLIIYGKGNKRDDCIDYVKRHHAEDRIVFDSVGRDDVPRVQSEADVLVLALPKENARFSLPSKITSYMLSGRPILASVDLNSAATRYIKEANCGIVVEPDNEIALADAFTEIGKMDFEKLKTMGINGKIFADRTLTKKVNLSIVVEAIKECIESR